MLTKKISSDNISLVNHASVLIKSETVSLLTDPWFFGDAFNDGWALFYENDHDEICRILNSVTHIFISHEHPDHFSIPFFKKYSNKLIDLNIKIIFQETNDKRVITFLRILNLHVIEAKNNKWIELDLNIHIKFFSIGTIDSTFILSTPENYFINTNDCELSFFDGKKIKNNIKQNKPVILLHQFSYAAWRASSEWKQKAAKYKLIQLSKLNKLFNASLLIPFASFIYFAHEENFNLNSDVNSPKKVSDFLKNENIKYSFLSPKQNDCLISKLISSSDHSNKLNQSAIEFWEPFYQQLNSKSLYSPVTSITSVISENEKQEFLDRIKFSNNLFLMKCIKKLSFNFIFGDSKIYLHDINEAYLLNFYSIKKISEPKENCLISISHDSFNLIVRQVYGLDTLSVNGRLAEVSNDGFRKFIYSMGFLTLNSSGYGVRFRELFNVNLLERIVSITFRLILKND